MKLRKNVSIIKRDEKFLLKPVNKLTDAVRIALLFPGDYFSGMSSLGLQWLYRLLFLDRRVIVDRFFYSSWVRNPLLKSFILNKPITAFDVLFITASDYSQIEVIKNILKLYGLKKEEHQPLIISGGIAATIFYKEILGFSDLVFLGEVEARINDIIIALYEKRRDRKKLLSRLKKVEGMISCEDEFSLEKIQRYNLKNAEFASHSCFITKNTEFSRMGLVQVARGCRYNCGFCILGKCFKPYRKYGYEAVRKSIELLAKYTDRMGIMSADIMGTGYIKRLIKEWPEIRFSFSSLRIDDIDEDFLKLYIKSGNRSITFAPETGSEKIKKIIKKRISNRLIIERISCAAELGIKKVKLYFLYGLPGEELGDILKSIELIDTIIKKCLQITRKKDYTVRFNINFTGFIPLPLASLNQSGKDSNYLKTVEAKIRKRLQGLGNVNLSISK